MCYLFFLRCVGSYVAHVGEYFCVIITKISLDMTAIHRTDLLQVTAQSCGNVLLSLTMSGVTNLGDVFHQVRSSAPDEAGIVTIKLRNRTQGWTQQHNIVFRATSAKTSPKKRLNDNTYPSLFA